MRPAAFVAAAAAALALALVVAGCGGGRTSASRPDVPAPRPVHAPRHAVHLAFGAAERTVPAGYLGLSIEFQAIRAYTGPDASAIDPVFTSLVRGLSPGQAPVVRIGGNSTDVSWVPARGVLRPPFRGYALTRSWLKTTAAFAHNSGARMILGVNLAADDPGLSATEADAYVDAFGRRSIAAIEIGNEPNLYATLRQFTSRAGHLVKPRPATFDFRQFQQQFAAVAQVLPRTSPALALVGPAFSAGSTPSGPWPASMRAFLREDPSVSELTIHRYPLRNCYAPRTSPEYPTISNLLSPYATATFAAGIRRWARIAHREGRSLRVDELNSAACRGRPGVSNTFASALWATDALFSLLRVGVDAVNIHTLPDAAYQLFTFKRHDGRWSGRVMPVYYGLRLFADAAPAGSRLVTLDGATHDRRLSAWATRGRDGSARLALIDKHPGRPVTVEVRPPAGAGGAVSVQRLRAPSVRSRGRVTLGGRTFGPRTTTGTLRAPRLQAPGRAPNGDYVVTVPGGSAALVTFGASARRTAAGP